MTRSKPKSINGLMKYLREKKKIKISGSSHKKQLCNIGYYHGYKGYRYINNPTNKIFFNDFEEIMALYRFDMKVKSIIYPQIMFIETALKNYALEIIIETGKTEHFSEIYLSILDDYKSITKKSDKDQAYKKRLALRDHVYSVLTRDYKNKNKIVNHFYSKDLNVPIWAIFERISLGEFANFVSCMNYSTREKFSKKLRLNQGCDSDKKLVHTVIFALKDLRNSIAHNDIVFDIRFQSSSINRSVTECIKRSTKVKNVSFGSITDYIVLLTYILKLLGVPKTELKRFVKEFEDTAQQLIAKAPKNIADQIVHTDMKIKMKQLLEYITKEN